MGEGEGDGELLSFPLPPGEGKLELFSKMPGKIRPAEKEEIVYPIPGKYPM
jgi:hypothetical protein